MSERVPVSVAVVADQLAALGVEPGDTLLVHTSFSRVGPVEGGPTGLIEALSGAVGSTGTVVMPSWSGSGPPIFDPQSTEVARNLGVVAQTFWRLEGAERTQHSQAFAARGPQAGRILADPLPLPPHIPESPVGRVHELGGKVLLLGVNHDANTTIHLAELMAEVPYGVPKRCAVLEKDEVVWIEYRENDHCCQRFCLADAWLSESGTQRRGPVGHGEGRLIPAEHVVGEVVARLRADPLLFLHPVGSGCSECDDAHASVSS